MLYVDRRLAASPGREIRTLKSLAPCSMRSSQYARTARDPDRLLFFKLDSCIAVVKHEDRPAEQGKTGDSLDLGSPRTTLCARRQSKNS
jgi:hypothetical protein